MSVLITDLLGLFYTEHPREFFSCVTENDNNIGVGI